MSNILPIPQLTRSICHHMQTSYTHTPVQSEYSQGFTESVGRGNSAIFRKDDVGVLHENMSK